MKPIEIETRTVTNPDGAEVKITRSFIPLPLDVNLEDREAVAQAIAESGIELTGLPEGYVEFDEAVRRVNAGEYPEITRAVDVLNTPLKKGDAFNIQKICDGLRRKSPRNERRAIKKAYNKRLKK